MDPENVYILWWLLGFSYFIHIANAAVSIWDRVRAKPGLLDRLSEKVSKDELKDALTVVSARLDGMHASMRDAERTNQSLFRDIMRAIGSVESARSRGPQ